MLSYNDRYTILPAGPDEAANVEDCVRRCFRDAMTFGELLDSGDADAPVVAHAIYRRRNFCGFGLMQVRPRCAVAVLVAVLPRHRRRGAAGAWLEHVDRVAAANETNGPALELLKSFGYISMLLQRDYFPGPPDGSSPARDRIVLVRQAGAGRCTPPPAWLPDRARRTMISLVGTGTGIDQSDKDAV